MMTKCAGESCECEENNLPGCPHPEPQPTGGKWTCDQESLNEPQIKIFFHLSYYLGHLGRTKF